MPGESHISGVGMFSLLASSMIALGGVASGLGFEIVNGVPMTFRDDRDIAGVHEKAGVALPLMTESGLLGLFRRTDRSTA